MILELASSSESESSGFSAYADCVSSVHQVTTGTHIAHGDSNQYMSASSERLNHYGGNERHGMNGNRTQNQELRSEDDTHLGLMNAGIADIQYQKFLRESWTEQNDKVRER